MGNIKLIDCIRALGIALMVVATVGCYRQVPTPAPAANASITRAYVEYRVGGQTVREFGLSDGTRCVMYPAYALTCEWRQPVVLVPKVE